MQHAQGIAEKMGIAINSPEGKALLSEELPPHEREPWTLMAKHKQAQFCPGTTFVQRTPSAGTEQTPPSTQ